MVLGNILTIVIITGIFWAMFLRPQIKEVQSEKSLKPTLPKASEHVDLDSPYNDYRKALARWFNFGMPGLAFSVFFFIGLGIFIWKTMQTSDVALRYSSQAHTEIGTWALSLGVLLLIAGGFAFPGILAQRSFQKTKEAFTTTLRDALAAVKDQSETREVIEIERMLTKLESAKPHLPAQWENRL